MTTNSMPHVQKWAFSKAGWHPCNTTADKAGWWRQRVGGRAGNGGFPSWHHAVLRAPPGLGRVSRAWRWRRLRRLRGSVQSAATASAGARTKVRSRKDGCGIARPAERQQPPSHNTMSRSSTRADQRWPPVRRPKARSMAFRHCSRAGGSSDVRITATPLA